MSCILLRCGGGSANTARGWLQRALGPAAATQTDRKEYARGPVHTNTIEGYFSILKRGLIGTFHHVSEAHLQRYVTEFGFRYNNRTAMGVTDAQRANVALKGM